MNLLLCVLAVATLSILSYVVISAAVGFRGFYEPVPLTDARPRIVVSLSTLPSRIDNIDAVIRSINDNTMRPDAIYVNVPTYSKREQRDYHIPPKLHAIDNVIVNRIDTDYGPVTKLYPTLENEIDPETIIICIDDDHQYDSDLINNLVERSNTYPDSAICLSGWNYVNLGAFALPLRFHVNNVVQKVKVLQCYNGVLYRRKFFDDSFDGYIRLKECFTVDDILISKYLNDNDVDILSIPYNFKHKSLTYEQDVSPLCLFNLKNNSWIKCINA
jgi:hypothetical protein